MQEAIVDEPAAVLGTIDKEEIRKVIKANVVGIRHCYERELPAPQPRGSAAIEFTIDGSGVTTEIRPRPGSDRSAAFMECMAAQISKWRFPMPDGGVVRVTLPFFATDR